jgi:hypothetical protein
MKNQPEPAKQTSQLRQHGQKVRHEEEQKKRKQSKSIPETSPRKERKR